MRRLIILPAFVEDWGMSRSYGPFAAASVLLGCLKLHRFGFGGAAWSSPSFATVCPALTLSLLDWPGAACGGYIFIFRLAARSSSSLKSTNREAWGHRQTTPSALVHTLESHHRARCSTLLPNSPLSEFSSIKMPGQKLYPRATVKKIVKAHSNCSVSKNADVMVPIT